MCERERERERERKKEKERHRDKQKERERYREHDNMKVLHTDQHLVYLSCVSVYLLCDFDSFHVQNSTYKLKHQEKFLTLYQT